MRDAKPGDGMARISDAKLAAKSHRRDASVMVGKVQNLRIGNRAQQVADKTVEFRIGDEMRRLLVAKGSAQNTRKAEQRRVATSQAIGTAVGAD